MEYTKGEWEKQGNKILVHNVGIIAICPSPQNGGTFNFIHNSQLISAAPDLYEACKAIEYIARVSSRFMTDYPIAKKQIAEAIAKVESK